jgi:hypothetical protein
MNKNVNKYLIKLVRLIYFFIRFSYKLGNKCSIEMFIKLALTLFFKRQQDSNKDQSQFDELSIEYQ